MARRATRALVALMSHTHVIGAGIAGLAAAVKLARNNCAVSVYEAAGQAGGRCRSFFDSMLGRTIDNGNHFLLTGNTDAIAYLGAIGSSNRMIGPPVATFPFVDIRTGERWNVRPNSGILPWWILKADRRVAGTRGWHYLPGLSLALTTRRATVANWLRTPRLLYERFWEPLAVGALNTPAYQGAARLLWPVLRETFLRGEACCRPRVAKTGLSDALVDPAVEILRSGGAAVRFGMRLRAMDFEGYRVHQLDFGRERVSLLRDDHVIIALPPWEVAPILPSILVPRTTQPIVNVHFLLPCLGAMPADLPFVGIIGGTVQWIFVRGDVASVTVSAAVELVAQPAEIIATNTWKEVAQVLGHNGGTLPPYRVIKERRATFAQTPDELTRRPKMRTDYSNIYLAGAYVDTGLPATIESAARSGHAAAGAILRR